MNNNEKIFSRVSDILSHRDHPPAWELKICILQFSDEKRHQITFENNSGKKIFVKISHKNKKRRYLVLGENLAWGKKWRIFDRQMRTFRDS